MSNMDIRFYGIHLLAGTRIFHHYFMCTGIAAFFFLNSLSLRWLHEKLMSLAIFGIGNKSENDFYFYERKKKKVKIAFSVWFSRDLPVQRQSRQQYPPITDRRELSSASSSHVLNLDKFGTRPEVWNFQWEFDSLIMVCEPNSQILIPWETPIVSPSFSLESVWVLLKLILYIHSETVRSQVFHIKLWTLTFCIKMDREKKRLFWGAGNASKVFL